MELDDTKVKNTSVVVHFINVILIILRENNAKTPCVCSFQITSNLAVVQIHNNLLVFPVVDRAIRTR
jgi:hypothetical protein